MSETTDSIPFNSLFGESPPPPAPPSEPNGRPPKKVLSQAQLDKMAEGRRAAFERKKLEKEEAARRPPAPPPQASHSPDPIEDVTAPPSVPDYAGKRPRTLLDIFAQFPIGDGKHYVQVNRVSPKLYLGQNVAGVQNALWNQTTDEEFATYYGGAEYELRVYGPGEREAVGPDGAFRIKAWTDPIKYSVPGPPNPRSAIPEENDMPPVQRIISNGARRPGSMMQPQAADVDMVRANNEHAETMDDRNRREAAEERQRNDDDRKRSERLEFDKAKLAEDSRQKDLDRAHEAAQAQVALVRELADSKSGNGVTMADLLAVMQTQNGKQDNSAELTRMAERHQDSIKQMAAQHALAIDTERLRGETLAKSERTNADVRVEGFERRAKDAEERAARRIAEIEEQRDRRIREIESMNNDRITRIEGETARRMSEIETRHLQEKQLLIQQHTDRMQDLKDNFARELATKDSITSTSEKMMGHTNTVEVRVLKTEIERLMAEVERFRSEAEKNKDWIGKLNEFNELAEQMGFERAGEGAAEGEEGPSDWKSVAAGVAKQFVGGLPDLAKAAGEALQKARQAGVNPAQIQAEMRQRAMSGVTAPQMMAQPPQHRAFTGGPAFATEDGLDFSSPSQVAMVGAPNFMNPTARPLPLAGAVQSQLSEAEQQMRGAQQQPAPIQQELPFHQQQAIPMPPIPAQSQPPQAPPPVQAATEEEASADAEEQGLSLLIAELARSYEATEPPASVASKLVQFFTENGRREVLKVFTINQALAMITARQSEDAQKLSRREGQKYLREVWAAIQAELKAS